VELGRVDYLLRAMQIPAGRHQVELSFFPKSVNTTETFAYSAYGILILVLLGAGLMEYRRRQKKSSVSA
jgi:predicted transporter